MVVVLPPTYPTYRRRLAISYARETSIAPLVEDVTAVLDDTPGRVVVGITGPPGAGKSTAAVALAASFDGASYLPMDGFHLSNAVLDRLGRRDRKGAVDTFDAAGYVTALERVRSEYRRREVYVPAFDRGLDEPVAAGHVVPAESRLVITEGNYLGVPEGEWASGAGTAGPAVLRRLPDRRAAATVGGAAHRGWPYAAGRRGWVDEVDEPNARLHRGARGSLRWRYAEEVDESNARLIAGTRQFCDAVLDGG